MTQNVDELHQRAGTDPDKVIEVHGTARWTRCWDCGDRRPMSETLDRVRAGEDDPACLVCGGIVKSDTISFGQALIPEVIDRAFDVSKECDLMLAVGSTLSVYPAASCVPVARGAGATVVIVNAEPTEMDHLADHLLRGQIADILPIVARWCLQRRQPTSRQGGDMTASWSEYPTRLVGFWSYGNVPRSAEGRQGDGQLDLHRSCRRAHRLRVHGARRP